MRIGVASNPSSGAGRGARYGTQVRSLLAVYGATIVELSGRNAAECLAAARSEVLAGNLDALFVVGGDGMVHIGVEALAGTHVPLGIISVGSGNDIAREFGLPIRNVPRAVHRAVTALLAGRSRATDTIEVTHRSGNAHALAVLSAGIDAATNLRTNQLTWPKGNLRYARALFQCLTEFSPYGLEVEVDGKVASGAATLVAAANTRFVGGGMNIAPSARTDDGLLDIIIARAMSVPEIVSLFPLLYGGRHIHAKGVHLLRGQHIRINAKPSAGAPAPTAMADGEIIGEVPLNIYCRPGSLELLV
ncbi:MULTISPECIES: diacylglycerol kinase family protein [unclassified Actinobaculum]|uniref:diacylglycerol/lipid kinase family protein n=1 Tax=unclassified Actinobaculum TaxID=2609299 RepID=UPI0013DDC01F|nr:MULTISPECIES: diacylglycerol kinase family protein [unclassified Actinobaculum]